MKISSFSKTVYDFHENLHSHSTPKEAPACAKASKSYDWNERNIAKVSPKMAKNSHFSIFSKTPYDSNEIFYSHSSPNYGPLCAFPLNAYGWDVRNIAKINPKMAKKQPFSDFFDFLQKLHTIRTKFSTVIPHRIKVCNFIKIV